MVMLLISMCAITITKISGVSKPLSTLQDGLGLRTFVLFSLPPGLIVLPLTGRNVPRHGRTFDCLAGDLFDTFGTPAGVR